MFTTTATNLPRFMSCNGSRLVEGFIPSTDDDEDKTRHEGNAVHWLIQQVHEGKFLSEELIDRKAENGVYITPEMVEHADQFLKVVGNSGTVEYDTSFSDPNGKFHVRARTDRADYLTDTQTLLIDDFKYGWGIVEPTENWTLIAHAIGWWFKNLDKPILNVVFTIYQPRPHHPEGRIRKWEISFEELKEYYNILYTALSNPSDMLHTGNHCYKCPSLVNCPAAHKAQMNALDYSEKAFNDKLCNEEISFQLDQFKRSIEILEQGHNALCELATHKLKHGEMIKNYSVEAELANRSWKDFVTLDIMKSMTDIDIKKEQLITPKQAETAGVKKEIIDSFTERKSKGVKLVRINENAKAKKLFETKKGKK